jgi:hypothetical protein
MGCDHGTIFGVCADCEVGKLQRELEHARAARDNAIAVARSLSPSHLLLVRQQVFEETRELCASLAKIRFGDSNLPELIRNLTVEDLE